MPGSRLLIAAFAGLMVALSTFDAAADDSRLLTTSLPPYSFEQDGKMSGLMVQIVEEMARRVGNTSEIRMFPWKRAQVTAMATAADEAPVMIFPLGRTPSREEKFKWVAPILSDQVRLFTWRSEHGKAGPEPTTDSKVGVLVESSALQILKNQGYENVFLCRDIEECAKLLARKRIDAWATLSLIAPYTLQTLKMDYELLKASTVLVTFDYYIAANPTLDDTIANRWRRALSDMRADGTYWQIIDRYNAREASLVSCLNKCP